MIVHKTPISYGRESISDGVLLQAIREWLAEDDFALSIFRDYLELIIRLYALNVDNLSAA